MSLEQPRDIVRRRANGSIPKYVEAGIPSSSLTLPPPIDPSSRGGRLFHVRRMARVSRKALEDACGLTDGHVGRIECDIRRLNEIDTLIKLRRGLSKLGVETTFEWLAQHVGPEPTYNERFWQRFPKDKPEQWGRDVEATAVFERLKGLPHAKSLEVAVVLKDWLDCNAPEKQRRRKVS